MVNFENMKTHIFKIAFFFIFAICSKASLAQDYKTGIGIRGGLSNGITVKHFIADKAALEFLLANRWKGYNFTVLYEVHNNIGSTSGLKWYYGAGGHVGHWRGYSNHPWFPKEESYNVLGVDLILGIEYTIPNAPINFSLDYKPGYNLYGYTGFWGDEGALSIRIVF
jgi:hypothetical protein